MTTAQTELTDRDFWNSHEWGPTITEEERTFRIGVALKVAAWWDEMRKLAPHTVERGGLTVNEVCASLVTAFSEAMLLGEGFGIVAMDELAELPADKREAHLRKQWARFMYRPPVDPEAFPYRLVDASA